MNPSWNDAPDWAQWVAQDADGEWRWFEMRPHKVFDYIWYAGGRSVSTGNRHPNHKWESTLEGRP